MPPRGRNAQTSRVELLQKLVGSWRDRSGTEYEVLCEADAKGTPSCTVRTRKPSGAGRVYTRIIQLDPHGYALWAKSHWLDESASGSEALLWQCCDHRGWPFHWTRMDRHVGLGWKQEGSEQKGGASMSSGPEGDPASGGENGSSPRRRDRSVSPKRRDRKLNWAQTPSPWGSPVKDLQTHDENSVSLINLDEIPAMPAFTTDDVQPRSAMLEGSWVDGTGKRYEVVEDRKQSSDSCTSFSVDILTVNGACNHRGSVITVSREGAVTWAKSFKLHEESRSNYLHWEAFTGKKSFCWWRSQGASPSLPQPSTSSTQACGKPGQQALEKLEALAGIWQDGDGLTHKVHVAYKACPRCTVVHRSASGWEQKDRWAVLMDNTGAVIWGRLRLHEPALPDKLLWLDDGTVAHEWVRLEDNAAGIDLSASTSSNQPAAAVPECSEASGDVQGVPQSSRRAQRIWELVKLSMRSLDRDGQRPWDRSGRCGPRATHMSERLAGWWRDGEYLHEVTVSSTDGEMTCYDMNTYIDGRFDRFVIGAIKQANGRVFFRDRHHLDIVNSDVASLRWASNDTKTHEFSWQRARPQSTTSSSEDDVDAVLTALEQPPLDRPALDSRPEWRLPTNLLDDRSPDGSPERSRVMDEEGDARMRMLEELHTSGPELQLQ